MSNEELREIMKKLILFYETKDVGILEKYLHDDYAMDYDKGYYGENWNPHLIKSMGKNGLIEYMKNVFAWQDYKVNHYDILIEGNKGIYFVNFDLKFNNCYLEEIEKEVSETGPFKYNVALLYEFKDGKAITGSVIQDTDTFRLATGDLILNQEEGVKVRKYLEALRSQEIID